MSITPEDLARARGAPNPFLLDRIDSAWEGTFTDVDSINVSAFTQCLGTIETVRQTRQSRGLLLTGEPGSGKSHLLRRLRVAISQRGKDAFVYVPPVATSGRIYGELLQRVVEDIIRQPGEGAATQLEAMVVRELLQSNSPVTPMQMWTDLRRRTPPGPALFDTLGQPFELLAVRLMLDADLCQVLRHYLAGHWRHDAYRWLTGRSVPEDILPRLGVKRTLEDEADARQALVALSRLAGRASVLVLTFDQLEGMQLRPDDIDGVRMFGNVVADLLLQSSNIATISCVQQYFHADLTRALPPALMDRVAQDLGRIELLQPPAAEQIVIARLKSEDDLAAARTAIPENPLWPFDAAELQKALPKGPGGGVTARAALHAARVLFEKWRNAGQSAPAQAPVDTLKERFDAFVMQAMEEAPEEGVYADGILKLLDIRRPGHVRRANIRGIDALIDQPPGRTGVSVCHSQNMTSLAARLRQVNQAIDQGHIQRAVVVRDARLAISPTARQTQEYLGALQARPHAVLRPGSATYAAVAAARKLLADAASGDLEIEGRTVPSSEVQRWLLEVKPFEAFELLDAIDAAASDSTSALLEKLRTVLDGKWVLSLPEAASHLDIDPLAIAAELTSGGAQMVGLIRGPTPVVYLRPEGLRRS